MWSYYGAKTNIADLYPPPKHGKIIEPFAGTARYSLEHWENEVLLVDKFERIIDIWHYLQQASPREILSLPRFKEDQLIDSHTYDCAAQRDLVGFLVGYGLTHPANKPSAQKMRDRPGYYEYALKRIASDLHKVKHWKIRGGDYTEIDNETATWFVDPPYQHGGRNYACSNKQIEFSELSDWCKTRNGKVIVCENTKADWLPFRPLKQIRGAQAKSVEAIWSNEPTAFDNKQLTFFE